MGFINDRSEEPWKTIDQDRGIYLIQTKINSPMLGSDSFELRIDGKKVTFCGTRRTKLVTDIKKNDVLWEIFSLVIPSDLKKRKYEIKNIIHEAMEVFGFLHSTENIRNIKINFLL